MSFFGVFIFMRKFILTEEERKRIKFLYEQEKTSAESKQVNWYDFGDLLYKNGLNQFNKEYPAKLYLNQIRIQLPTGSYYTVGNFELLPKSEMPIILKLELRPTEWEQGDGKLMELTPEQKNTMKNIKSPNYIVYSGGEEIQSFGLRGELNNLYDANGTKITKEEMFKRLGKIKRIEI